MKQHNKFYALYLLLFIIFISGCSKENADSSMNSSSTMQKEELNSSISVEEYIEVTNNNLVKVAFKHDTAQTGNVGQVQLLSHTTNQTVQIVQAQMPSDGMMPTNTEDAEVNNEINPESLTIEEQQKHLKLTLISIVLLALGCVIIQIWRRKAI